MKPVLRIKGDDAVDEFEELLITYKNTVERFVKYRLNAVPDADDILQEVYITAYEKFHQLKNKDSFKFWILTIARNKCNDYFRKMAKFMELPIDEINENQLTYGIHGKLESTAVSDIVDLLPDKDKQMLYLYFWKDIPQEEIARKLNIPAGTVKSRLYTAKQNFKNQYQKGDNIMKTMPKSLPEYKIEAVNDHPFSIKWEEVMGWFLVPKLGEKLNWAMYNTATGKMMEFFETKVNGKATVHNIEGVDISVKQTVYDNGKPEVTDWNFVAQLTETHCRYLAAVRQEKDMKYYYTFLDEKFAQNWGFGENNCGNEVNFSPKGDIKRIGNEVTHNNKDFLLDIVGRYNVTVNEKTYDTVCIMDIETYDNNIVSEQFIDKNGRTILWRRYNKDTWQFESRGKKWSEIFPGNDRITVNGETYVQWYDCITDYIF